MPWHQSKSDPRKVYDARHETVAVCQTSDQASLIVRAVNALPQDKGETFVKLREPEPSGPLETFEPDKGCCGRQLANAIRMGITKSLTSWDCKSCGMNWRPTQTGPIRHWSPQAEVMVTNWGWQGRGTL